MPQLTEQGPSDTPQLQLRNAFGFKKLNVDGETQAVAETVVCMRIKRFISFAKTYHFYTQADNGLEH